MHGRSRPVTGARLERSCSGTDVRRRELRLARFAEGPGVEGSQVALTGEAYAPHRHDTYGIGLTLAGVQSFRYRGVQRHCLPGQYHLLHPDELHDGAPGTEAGFVYRIFHVEPALIQAALGGGSLPFALEPVMSALGLGGEIIALRNGIDEPFDDLVQTELIADIARALIAASNGSRPARGSLCWPALRRVREALLSLGDTRLPMAQLEAIAGIDRWRLARQFRAAYGTSLGRYQTLRRLDRVRQDLRAGIPPAGAAVTAGFADQSHMARHFKRAYGLTPARWQKAFAPSGAPRTLP